MGRPEPPRVEEKGEKDQGDTTLVEETTPAVHDTTTVPGAMHGTGATTIVDAKRNIRAAAAVEDNSSSHQSDDTNDGMARRIQERRRNRASPSAAHTTAPGAVEQQPRQNNTRANNNTNTIVQAKGQIRSATAAQEDTTGPTPQKQISEEDTEMARIHQRRQNRIANQQAAAATAAQQQADILHQQEQQEEETEASVPTTMSAVSTPPNNSVSIAAATAGTNTTADDLNDIPSETLLAAEIVEDPVMAEAVDEAEQKRVAQQKYRKTIGFVILAFLAVLLAVIGGLCANGFCSAGTALTVENDDDACSLFVSGRVNVRTTVIDRPNALSKSGFFICTNITSGEPALATPDLEDGLCAIEPAGCQELPHQITMLLNGGSCADNEELDAGWNTFSCQDGAEGLVVPSEFGTSVYIRITDLLQQDVTYFDDTVMLFDFISLTNRGAPIGPDILMRIYDSEASANDGSTDGLLQTVFYYDICSDLREMFFRFGALQPTEYLYGSQTLTLNGNARTMEFEVLADGPTKLLQTEDGGDDAAVPVITIDEVVLTPSFDAVFSTVVDDPTANDDANIITFEKTQFEPGIVVASATIDVPWMQNSTERFTVQAEVIGTGPNGEVCSGAGVINFLTDYV